MASNQGETIHRTEHYVVRIGAGEYEAVNTKTGLIEATEKLLPQAILHAENTNSFMVNRLWRWVAAQGKQQGDTMDREEPMQAFNALTDLDDSIN